MHSGVCVTFRGMYIYVFVCVIFRNASTHSLNFILCVCACVLVPQCICRVRGKPGGVSFLLLPYGSWRLNSGHQVWQQASYQSNHIASSVHSFWVMVPYLPIRLDWPSWPRNFLVSAFPALGLQACTIILGILTWVLGTEHRSSCLQREHFTDWAILTGPWFFGDKIACSSGRPQNSWSSYFDLPSARDCRHVPQCLAACFDF